MNSPTFKRDKMILMLTISISFIILYFDVFNMLLYNWSENPDYSHGYFVPFMVMYLIWNRRETLIHTVYSPSIWGLLLVFVGLVLYAVGYIGAEHFLQGISMIPVILGIILFLFGKEIMTIVFVPISYLLFMIPLPAIIWSNFAFSLKLFTTELAVFILQSAGSTILRDGNVITLPTMTLEVVDACSGLRSLISLMALCAFLAYLSTFTIWKRILLFLSSIPIAILSNIIRIIVIVISFQYLGIDLTKGFAHTLSGIFVFGIGLILVIIVYQIIAPRYRKNVT